MLTASVDTEKIARFETAKRKGVEYLLSHLKPNGELGEVKDGFYFYRAPWTFTVAGETEGRHERGVLGAGKHVDAGGRLR